MLKSSAGYGYKVRRKRLAARLREDAAGSPAIALFFSGEETGLESFSVDPTFFYLTGVDEPGGALFMALQEEELHEVLLLPPSDPARARWTGDILAAGGLTPSAEPNAERRRTGEKTGFTDIAAYYQLDSLLERSLRSAGILYLDFPAWGEGGKDRPARLLVERFRRTAPYVSIRHGGRIAAELRRVKDDWEIALMEAAAAVVDQAHEAVLRHLQAGMYEYEIQAVVEYVFRAAGACSPAFPSIIGSGPNSCVLHYEKNTRCMASKDLVVCDIGCRKNYYCSDETRTYPVSGRYTRRQAEVYDAVLAAHAAAFAAARPGVRLSDIHKAAYDSPKKAGFASFFFPGTSHYPGLEPHDVGTVDAPLEAGSVLTIEPGVYIARGEIGIRIEDDVVITGDGARRLSDAPRDRRRIERALAAAGKKIIV